MTYWRSRRWRLCSCHHTPPQWKSAQSRHRSNLHRQVRFPWTGTASAGMEKSFTEFKKLEQKGKNCLEKNTIIIFCCMQWYLDWQPAINVFEIERSLIFAECESVICVKTLQFFLVAHNEYLNERPSEEMVSIFSAFWVPLECNFEILRIKISFQSRQYGLKPISHPPFIL